MILSYEILFEEILFKEIDDFLYHWLHLVVAVDEQWIVGTAMQCGRVGGCLLLLEVFRVKRLWRPFFVFHS